MSRRSSGSLSKCSEGLRGLNVLFCVFIRVKVCSSLSGGFLLNDSGGIALQVYRLSERSSAAKVHELYFELVITKSKDE